MSKILFVPFNVISGFIAGKIATTVFERIWRLVDDQESPEPDQPSSPDQQRTHLDQDRRLATPDSLNRRYPPFPTDASTSLQ